MWLPSLSQEDPLEKGMATHSRILAWRIPMNRGAWQATVNRVTKSRTRLKQLSIHAQDNAGALEAHKCPRNRTELQLELVRSKDKDLQRNIILQTAQCHVYKAGSKVSLSGLFTLKNSSGFQSPHLKMGMVIIR